jgi:two-component system phosphate regulon sensor histidine kinase PhoR
LRTPLTVVNGFIEHMQDDPAMDVAQRQRFVELMIDQSRRMLRLVDDLLTLSRLEARDNLPREEDIDVEDLLAGLVEQGRALSDGGHDLSLACEPCRIKGSRGELESAFGNLISNAVRYTPKGGKIEVSWKVSDGRGVFAVADNGMGIAQEHLPRLTERFYRVDRGRSRETGGTGLGLAIVKHVLLRHQAELMIESELGKGSRFMTVFPAWRLVCS